MKEPEWDVQIEKGKTELNYWRDIWKFRELFYILSWRDIRVRYKQTVIGATWAVIRPVLMMVIFTFVFSRVAKLPSESSAPYALMVFCGLLPWQFFSNSLAEASNSLVTNSNLITKVYFPRMIIPASAVITSFVDFGVTFLLLLLMMLGYQYPPSWQIVFLPFFLILAFGFSFGTGLFLTALNVSYRDFKYIIPFIIQFGLYFSPVGFSSNIVPEKWAFLYQLNPMVGVIDGFRWSILGSKEFPAISTSVSVLVTLVSLMVGVTYFRRVEKGFADSI